MAMFGVKRPYSKWRTLLCALSVAVAVACEGPTEPLPHYATLRGTVALSTGNPMPNPQLFYSCGFEGPGDFGQAQRGDKDGVYSFDVVLPTLGIPNPNWDGTLKCVVTASPAPPGVNVVARRYIQIMRGHQDPPPTLIVDLKEGVLEAEPEGWSRLISALEVE